MLVLVNSLIEYLQTAVYYKFSDKNKVKVGQLRIICNFNLFLKKLTSYFFIEIMRYY